MTDGTVDIQPIHLHLIHGENVFVDHFLQAHHITKSYIHSSDLAALISDAAVLAKVERNPLLRAAVLGNPFLAEEISHSPRLLNILVQNPSIITSILANPKLLTLIKQNPQIVSEIVRSSSSIEEILQNMSERNKTNSLDKNIKNITEKKLVQSAVLLHKSEKPIIATNKVLPTIKEMLPKAGLKIPTNIPIANTTEGKAQAKLPLIRKPGTVIYIDPKTLASHPSLLILLGATAFSASRTKIVSGNQEELETQSERQLDTLQEIDPIHEVEEISEVHLMKETIA